MGITAVFTRTYKKRGKNWVRPVKAIAQYNFDLFQICALFLNKKCIPIWIRKETLESG
jgi:hypothetical protein